jgi:hypothetical protein
VLGIGVGSVVAGGMVVIGGMFIVPGGMVVVPCGIVIPGILSEKG